MIEIKATMLMGKRKDIGKRKISILQVRAIMKREKEKGCGY